ncbi:DUF3320 domain-containing protein [Hymenobacter crusticola]|uniref:DNA helicase n=1 Tax=Hymenobacter crusticola TaxID=1770526 RepID=A0A243W6G3_9BACT|nr:DUF3320 domain-containing protein [Hymenobacter crusticola]OUJ69946.1 hypothetical protein BXP70_25735 [Hymenobacter crusticola]
METPEILSSSELASLRAKLEASRLELLDLGLRNPLLNFRLSKAQGVAVVREESAPVFDVLVRQGKTMYFQAVPELSKKKRESEELALFTQEQGELDENEELVLPEIAVLTEDERQALLTDNKLQTAEPLAKLERRLLNTYYTARTSLEEQGVNILYLALGMLTWYEAASSSEARRAPLILVPVVLERGTAAERFKLSHTGADIEGNLSLQAKMRTSFGVDLPLPEFDEESDLLAYYASVENAVSGLARWQVDADSIALGFFSFGKFMLYRDLDPATWPANASLLNHPAIGALLGADKGFRDSAPSIGDGAFLDTESPAAELHQVLDADSSQLLALLAVHEGRNLVVQGPPGTGKSQTIANMIAEAIGAGKKVLFVAEKMAALEVVKRRLDALGLGVACLELHSHKANKKVLHEELRQTLSLGRPAVTAGVEDRMAQLPYFRQALNDYALAVNAPIGRSRRTAQQVAGELLRLREERGEVALPRLPFAQLENWTDADAAHAESVAARLQATLLKTGVPVKLLFWGSKLTVLLPASQDSIGQALREATTTIQALMASLSSLAGLLKLDIPANREAAEVVVMQAKQTHREAEVVHSGQALAAVTELLHTGATLARLMDVPLPESRVAAAQLPPLARRTHQEGLSAHDPALRNALQALQGTAEALAALISLSPPSDTAAAAKLLTTGQAELREAVAAYSGQAVQAVRALHLRAERVADLLHLAPPTNHVEALALMPVARHAQAAPNLTGIAVTDAYWRLNTLPLPEAQMAAERLVALHRQYDAVLQPTAWSQSLLTERQIILTYHSKWWRIFHSPYRKAHKHLQTFWQIPLPAADAIVAGIDAIEEAMRLEETLLGIAPLAQRLFRESWQNRQTDWTRLAHVSRYLIDTHQRIGEGILPTALLEYLAGAPDPAATISPIAALETALASYPRALRATAEALVPARAGLLGTPAAWDTQYFSEQISVLEAWAAARPQPEQVAAGLSALEVALRHQTQTWQNVSNQLKGVECSALAPNAETDSKQPFAIQQAVLTAWAAGTPAPGEVAAALVALEAALLVHENAITAVITVCAQAPDALPALTTGLQQQSLREQDATLVAWRTRTPSPATILALLATAEQSLVDQHQTLGVVLERLQMDEARRYGPGNRLSGQSFTNQLSAFQAWTAELPALHLVTEWNNVGSDAYAAGLLDLVVLGETWEPAARFLVAVVQQTWLEYLQRVAYAQHPALMQFERASHEATATRFRQADKDSLLFNRIRAMRRHHEQLPTRAGGGQLSLLKNEFAKKARHIPLRKLMGQAGHAVQAIKPVFMMSPLSVANFLPPSSVEFDLVIFDEASQVKPVDALGAVARGKQLIVVGDSKQLPPTSFFDSLTGANDTDEENVTADIQSILELCKARQMPERMLRWHYRSLHQSLIAASNHLFYEDKLVIFPSPGGKGQLGLVYRHLPGTHYERGTTRTNPQEAAAVAEAVLHHARTMPQLTLGVVAFSTAQRQAIQDALEIRRKQHPEIEVYFNQHPHEPFFIKNLENVQGDERDVIFISIGYGRTKEGYLAMSFGPLNGEGGERRLNVLITRAKQRCEVFTNLTADDLDLGRTQAKGVVALKTFLNYAQFGRLNQNEETGREMDSPFEEAVYRALTARGYTVRPQIGSQGFYIDLAVVDPDLPGRYVLGIECDGAMYHSARSARDRDRLRQQVLESVGWRLHRIWSTDWFRDPLGEIERAVQAIENAQRLAAHDEPVKAKEILIPADFALMDLEREEPIPVESTATVPAYTIAELPSNIRQQELHLYSLSHLAKWVADVVAVESPVHIDEVTRRLASAAGASQVGSRIRASVAEAVQHAVRMSTVRLQNYFLWSATMEPATVLLRDRSSLPTVSRKLAFVAAEEIALAVLTVVRQSFAINSGEVVLPAARLLGFARIGDEQRQQFENITKSLVANRQLTEINGVLKVQE